MMDPAELDKSNESFRKVFASGPGVGLENRLKVYRNNVIRSLTDVAISALPMTRKLTGDRFLKQALRAYIIQNLPDKADLTLYGNGFPAFIKTYQPAKNLPYLYDLTRLEWAWETAYYAADDTALNPAVLADVPEAHLPGLCLSCRTSFALIQSDFPLDQIVDFCRTDGQKPFTLSERGVKLMVLRPDLKVEMHRLTDTEYQLLHALHRGKTIQQAVDDITGDMTNFDLTTALQKHFRQGTFSKFKIQNQEH